MALNQKTEIDEITVTDNGTVMVRTKTSIIDGETVIQTSLHRKPICPGDDYSNEEKMLQDICKSTHTPEVIEAYKAAMAAQGV
jgi:archaellum component FlaF (FlaF/FlaG flagellin family)